VSATITPLACLSGEAIELSLWIGRYAALFCAFITVALVAVSWKQRTWRWLPVYGTLLLVHPAWTMNPYWGDCGYSRRFFSVAFSAIFVALLFCHAFYPRVSVRRFLSIVCILCWIGWAFGEIWWFHGGFWRYGSPIQHLEASTAFQTYAMSVRPLLLYALLLSIVLGILYLIQRVGWRRVAV
jgi:hypothetical protein